MKNINKIITFLILGFVFSSISNNVFAYENSIDDVAPFSDENIIIKDDIKKEIKLDKVLPEPKTEDINLIKPVVTSPLINGNLDKAQIIKGEVTSGYNIKVYIDGKYRTILNVWPSRTGISGFFYQPIQKLSAGKHNVQFIATKNGKDYGSSDIVEFNAVEEYLTPDVLTPYYYEDDPSTYVVRGYAKTGSKIDVYLDDIKVRSVESLYGNSDSSYFALALKNTKEGDHKAYVISYVDGKVYKSKTIYFKTSYNIEIENVKKEENVIKDTEKDKEIKKEDKKIEESNNTKINNKNTTNTNNTKTKIDVKKEDGKTATQNEKQDNSIVIGIILLIVAILLILFWLVSENKDKVKKFIDDLFEEDEDNK